MITFLSFQASFTSKYKISHFVSHCYILFFEIVCTSYSLSGHISLRLITTIQNFAMHDFVPEKVGPYNPILGSGIFSNNIEVDSGCVTCQNTMWRAHLLNFTEYFLF